MRTVSSSRQKGAGEAGYMLLAVIVLVAIVLLMLAVAAPVLTTELRREKEVESQHRADQYVRAIRLFHKKLGAYPTSIEAMEKTNNVRYLRQRYVDPLTGKDDWRLIHVGQNKTTVSVFFGEPIGGLNGSGAGGLGSAAGLASGSPGTSTPGPRNALAGGFGDRGDGTTPAPAPPGGGGVGGGAGVGTGAGGGTTASGFPASSVSSLGAGGAGPIMGVGTSATGESILNPNQQTTFETEEDLYDPRIELYYQKGRLGGGAGSQSASGFGDQNKPGTGLNAPVGGTPPATPTTPR